jgi:hypothetical protein
MEDINETAAILHFNVSFSPALSARCDETIMITQGRASYLLGLPAASRMKILHMSFVGNRQ